jgi:predicted regulator of Ras-like GTPase activity (Roadblock/LC7/MglB family)
MNAVPRAALAGLARMRGVRSALLTTEHDGLPAAGVSIVGVDEDALAAFAMALLRRARLANGVAGYGDTHFLALDAERGRLFVAAGRDVAVVVLGEPGANTGQVRVAMQRALGSLE